MPEIAVDLLENPVFHAHTAPSIDRSPRSSLYPRFEVLESHPSPSLLFHSGPGFRLSLAQSGTLSSFPE